MIAPFKSREPADEQEQELVENFFDALCAALLLPEAREDARSRETPSARQPQPAPRAVQNKESFVAVEGVELMLLIIKGKHFARSAAVKARRERACQRRPSRGRRPRAAVCAPQALDFALTRNQPACERLVDQAGLKTVFAVFSGRVRGARRPRSSRRLTLVR